MGRFFRHGNTSLNCNFIGGFNHCLFLKDPMFGQNHAKPIGAWDLYTLQFRIRTCYYQIPCVRLDLPCFATRVPYLLNVYMHCCWIMTDLSICLICVTVLHCSPAHFVWQPARLCGIRTIFAGELWRNKCKSPASCHREQHQTGSHQVIEYGGNDPEQFLERS